MAPWVWGLTGLSGQPVHVPVRGRVQGHFVRQTAVDRGVVTSGIEAPKEEAHTAIKGYAGKGRKIHGRRIRKDRTRHGKLLEPITVLALEVNYRGGLT